MFRDFSPLPQKYVNHNYLKDLRRTIQETTNKHDIFQKELMFMLWAYDLEFFTIDYASENYGIRKNHIADRIIYPLLKEGWLYKHFDRLTPSKEIEDHLFRDETKFNYRVRYALTQKARLMLQRFYNQLSSS